MALRAASSPGRNRSSRARSVPRKFGDFGRSWTCDSLRLIAQCGLHGHRLRCGHGIASDSRNTLLIRNPAAIRTPHSPRRKNPWRLGDRDGMAPFSRSARPIRGSYRVVEYGETGVRPTRRCGPEMRPDGVRDGRRDRAVSIATREIMAWTAGMPGCGDAAVPGPRTRRGPPPARSGRGAGQQHHAWGGPGAEPRRALWPDPHHREESRPRARPRLPASTGSRWCCSTPPRPCTTAGGTPG